METYNPEMAARVWQRVRAASRPVSEEKQLPPDIVSELPEMIAGEWADAAIYLQLSRQFQGKESAMLRQMFEQEQSHAACLKGIYTLLTGSHTVPRPATQGSQPVESTLRQCYGREMHSLAQYERLSTHSEYGRVFARLAQQEQEHCRRILELIGKLKR